MLGKKSLDDSKRKTLFEDLCSSLSELEKEGSSDDSQDQVWDELYSTMAPEHVEYVKGDFDQLHKYRENKGGVRSLSPLTEACAMLVLFHLLYTTGVLIGDALRIGDQGDTLPPLVMPPAMAKILIDDPGALMIFKCKSCYSWLPIRPESFDEGKLMYFNACPICGEAFDSEPVSPY